MKRFWLRNEKLFICLTYILSVMVFSVWAAQVAIVSTDTREQAWAKETLNNSDLQTNINGKETADAAIVKSDEAETLSAAWDLGTPSALVITNASGTASININGTVGATTPASGEFTTLAVELNTIDFGDVTEDYVLTFNAATNTWSGEASAGGVTTVDAIGDAAGAGAVDFVTYLQQWDVGTAGFQIGDGGSNYVQFSTTGITFGGTYTMSANLVSDYTTYTPAATEPATTDGLIRNVSGVSGYPDVLSQFDGTNVWRYISVDSDDTVGAGYMIGHDGTNWETQLIQSNLKVNTIGNFTTPTTTNPYAFTAANLYNSTLFYGATGEVDIAAGVDGMATIIYNTGAFTITIDPNGSEVVVRDGTAQTGGVSFTLSSGAGNFVALVFNGTQWVTMGFKGTLAEGT